jgi:SAM-dependent methyltransferase
MAAELVLTIAVPEAPACSLTLKSTASGLAAAGADTVRFDLETDRPQYLTSTGHSRFKQPPAETALPLAPETPYVLRGEARPAGGRCELWLIQYDDARRLEHVKRLLSGGAFALRFTAAAAATRCVLAVRLLGRGALTLRDLRLERELPATQEPRGIRTGPAAGFAAYSIFFDPAGYKPYIDRHHRHYAERGPEWYEAFAQELANERRVLELGCGPGLLMMALKRAGVAETVGLERDPVYLEQCRARGLDVCSHDLNLPFPFLACAAFDAVVSHFSFDYLAPIAQRLVLRECRRVLRPGGRLVLLARHDGQTSGDAARTSSPLSVARLREWLAEAGLVEHELSIHRTRLRCVARAPESDDRWPTRAVTLRPGVAVRPWTAPQPLLSTQSDAWDAAAARDFTPLTDEQKQRLLIDDHAVAYHTGYRDEQGTIARAIMRSVSRDGHTWHRDPLTPVLGGGDRDAWDGAGAAAGSVIPSPDPRQGRFAMYYTGRDAGGQWPGIGLAFSRDGVNWERLPQRILRVEDFIGLRYLALADVIRLASGRWLMHCEGWLEAHGGWAIMQAESDDGLTWRPTQLEPVLHPKSIAWAGKHVANPKVVPLADDALLLGFNAADASRSFQLGLAESADGRAWEQLPINPVICARGHRAESCFFDRDSWADGSQRVVYFEAAGNDTFRTSRVLTARCDPDSDWIGPPWHSRRLGLYRIAAGTLQADAGAREPGDALVRSVDLDRETEVAIRLHRGIGAGGVRLRFTDAAPPPVTIRRDGGVQLGERTVTSAAADAETISVVVRVLNPTRAPEIALHVWHDTEPAGSAHEPLPRVGPRLQLEIAVPPDEQPLTVERCTVWQPDPGVVDGLADAHTGFGVVHSHDPLFADISGPQFLQTLSNAGVGRALTVPYASGGTLDTFDQSAALLAQWPGRIFPLLRLAEWTTGDQDVHFQLDQLEVLWQQGLLAGLKINLGRPERPPPAVMEWLSARQLLAHVHAGNAGELDWLEENLLQRHGVSTLVSHFGGYPLSRRRYRRCIDWLDQYPEAYLVTSVVFYQHDLAEAIRRHPTRVLMGSDTPGIDIHVARALIERLPVPETSKRLVLGENLRFLTERLAWRRWEQLRQRQSLRFPPLPQDPADLEQQGFQVIPVPALPPDEDDQAKAFWSAHVSGFYLEPKPWSRLLAHEAAELNVASVLEFGCHAGRNLAAIRERLPAAQLVGLDINAGAVAGGRERHNLDLRVGDEQSLAEFADRSFDLVFTISVLDHVPRIDRLCQELMRVARRAAFFLEVTLPVEGKVVQHFDHRHGAIRESTAASYSWDVGRFIADHPRVWRLDRRPVYLRSGSLAPYYVWYRAHLRP